MSIYEEQEQRESSALESALIASLMLGAGVGAGNMLTKQSLGLDPFDLNASVVSAAAAPAAAAGPVPLSVDQMQRMPASPEVLRDRARQAQKLQRIMLGNADELAGGLASNAETGDVQGYDPAAVKQLADLNFRLSDEKLTLDQRLALYNKEDINAIRSVMNYLLKSDPKALDEGDIAAVEALGNFVHQAMAKEEQRKNPRRAGEAIRERASRMRRP